MFVGLIFCIPELLYIAVGCTDLEALFHWNLAPLATRRDIAMLGVVHRAALKKGPERAESVFFLLFDARSIRWNYGDGEIGVGPMGHGQGWCHGDCEWHGEFCVRSCSEFVLPTSMNSVLAIHDYSYIGFIPRIFLENDVTFT